MDNIVFLESNHIASEPFTTSKVMAEVTEIAHKKMKMSITTHKTALETFGKVVPHETTSPKGQTEVSYKLNEQQATLLITLLKNTPVIVAFKTELVRQFYAMRSELHARHIRRSELKPVRREFTDVIQEVDGSRWAYKLYTDLSYKMTLGKTAAQIRKERGAPPNAKGCGLPHVGGAGCSHQGTGADCRTDGYGHEV